MKKTERTKIKIKNIKKVVRKTIKKK